MRHPAPRTGRDATPLWAFARQGRLTIPQCSRCKTYEWPPRHRCSSCATETEWRDVSGLGRIVTYSVIHRAVNPELADEVPYAVAIVELDEGIRLLTNIVDCELDGLHCGQRVDARFEATSDPEMWVPVWSPIQEVKARA